MTQIAELAYKIKFDARELTKGLLSTRQQVAASKKIMVSMQSPLERYVAGLENLRAISARYTEVAKHAHKVEDQLERQYLEETKALTGLNREQQRRLEILTQEERIQARNAKLQEDRRQKTKADGIAYREGRQRQGAKRQAFFAQIDDQATQGRGNLASPRGDLASRLAAFKKNKRAGEADAEAARRKAEADAEAARKKAEADAAKQAAAEEKAARAARKVRMDLHRQMEASKAKEKAAADAAAVKKAAEEQKQAVGNVSRGLQNRSSVQQLRDSFAAEAAKQASLEEKAARAARKVRMDMYRQFEASKAKEQAAAAAREAKELAAVKRVTDALVPSVVRYRQAQAALNAMAAKYPEVAQHQVALGRQLELQYLREEAAVRKLTRAEQQRFQVLGGNKGSAAASPMGAALGTLGRRAAGVFAGYQGYDLAKDSVFRAADIQKNARIVGAQMGSFARSKKLMQDLRKMSNDKSLKFDALQESAKTMAIFGVQADKLRPILSALGDITGGDAERMKNLAIAVGQVTSATKLMGQERLQMVNAGFNPLAEISRTTGRSVASLTKDMENGKISAEMVINSLITATSGTGRFKGVMNEVAKDMSGALTRMENRADMLKIKLGEALEPAVLALGKTFEGTSGMLEGYIQNINDAATATKALVDITAKLTGSTGSKGNAAMTAVGKMLPGGIWAQLNAFRLASDVGGALGANGQGHERLDAGSRLRDTFGRGFLADSFNEEIDRRNAAQAKAAEEEEKRLSEASAEEARKAEVNQKENDRTARVAEHLMGLQNKVQKHVLGADSLEEVEILKEANVEEKARIKSLKEQIELIEKREAKKKSIDEDAKSIREKVDSGEKLKSDLSNLMVMKAIGALNEQQFNKARSQTLSEAVENGQSNRTGIAPSLQVGTQAAYSALVGARDMAREREFKEQQKHSLLQTQMLAAEKETNKILTELKEQSTGDGG